MATNSTEAVARVVREAMDRAGESSKGLAETTEIPRTTLVRRLTGKTSPFTITELERIASALGTTVVQILDDASAANVA